MASSENFFIEEEAHSKTYVALDRIARHLLDRAEHEPEGSLLNLQAAVVFIAFAFEAYLNHVGQEEIAFWEEIELISYRKKLAVITKQVGMKLDMSAQPGQTISELFKLRNNLAHGRTQTEKRQRSAPVPLPYDSIWRFFEHEKLTSQLIQHYRGEMRRAVEMINDARTTPDPFLWNEGSRMTCVGGPR